MLGLTVVNINISPNAATLVRTSMRTSNIKQFYQNTATLLKPSIICDCIKSVQRVKREDIAAAKRELFSAAGH